MSGSNHGPWFLGIDLGTGSCKTVVVNEQAQVLGFGAAAYEASTVRQKWQEQDAQAVIDGMVRSVQAAIGQSGVLPGLCARISVGGALHSLMALDSTGKPLTGIMTWATGRAAHQAIACREAVGAQDLYYETGCPAHGMYPLYKVLWLRDERPEVYGSAARYVSAKEYLFAQLTDHYVVDPCLAAGSGFLNVHDQRWNKACLDLAGIIEAQLSSLCDPGEVFHVCNEDLAARMGIPLNTPIVMGSADAVNSSIGAGGTLPGRATCMIGTSGALRTISDQPVLDKACRSWCYAIDNRHWLVGGAINNGGIALSWLQDLICSAFQDALPDKRLSFDELVLLASRAPIGAGGVFCLPFFAGERSPNWNVHASAAFFGLLLDHRMEHLARAVLEGICFRLRSIYDVLTEITGDICQIRASGGFTHSPFWLQLVADVLNRELVVPVWGETSSLGAAFWAIKAADTLSSLEDLTKLVHIEKIYRPQPEKAGMYDRLYAMYRDLCASVAPHFTGIMTCQEQINA